MTIQADGRDAVIVIGSGVGGLAAAAALAKAGRRVCVLERHDQPGGLTQTFRRREYRFDVGVHYIGGVGPEPGMAGQFGRLLHWLGDGRLRFASLGSPYDIVRLPGLEFPIEAPRESFVARLKQLFAADSEAIDAYFAQCDEAQRGATALFAARALPWAMSALVRWWSADRVRKALATTAAQAAGSMHDPRLAALLLARWGDYAIVPERAPLAVHALVLGSYDSGAYYPVGGPGRFAEVLGDIVRAAGGELRTRAEVTDITLADGRVSGVRLASGETLAAPVVVSAMGARNTVAALPDDAAPAWCQAVRAFRPSLAVVTLYIGLKGRLRALGPDSGASPANVWIYQDHDVGRLWERPGEEEAPGLFVSFPSLKDPSHDDDLHHTAQVVASCRWEPFAAWAGGHPGHRGEDYEAHKAWMAETLLAQFKRHFPRLAPLVDFHELATPVTQQSYVAAHHGAMGGLEMTAGRLGSDALRIRTPVPGLLLAGQDAASLGVQGAVMGGVLAAAQLEPRLWKELAA